MIFFLCFFNIAYSILFFRMGFRQVSIIPIIVSLFFFFLLGDIHHSEKYKQGILSFTRKNIISLFRMLFLLGVFLIVRIIQPLGYDQFESSILGILIIIGLNIILLLYSYLSRYTDGKTIFSVGMGVARIALILFLPIQLGVYTAVFTSLAVSGTTFALSHAMNDTSKYDTYIFILLIAGGFLTVVYSIFTPPPLVMIAFIMGCILLGLYVIKLSLGYIPIIPQSTQPTRSLESLIYRTSAVGVQRPTENAPLLTYLHTYVGNVPLFFRYAIILISAGSIFLCIVLFVISSLRNETLITNDILYRICIILYTCHFFVLKSINYPTHIHRVTVFFIINIGIYATLLHAFSGSTLWIVALGVIWNFINNIAISAVRTSSFNERLIAEDYLFWTSANLIGILINLYLIITLGRQPQITRAIVLIYLGIQGLLTYYNIEGILIKKKSAYREKKEDDDDH